LERSRAHDHTQNGKALIIARLDVSLVPGDAVASVMLFWGVGFAALGWLFFKIAELM
jgi:hypothetical protein